MLFRNNSFLEIILSELVYNKFIISIEKKV